jgi:hypothetical protein
MFLAGLLSSHFADTRYRRERNSCRVQAWLGLAA